MSTTSQHPRSLGAPLAQLLAFAWVMVLNALWIACKLPAANAVSIMVPHFLYDAGQILALGVFVSVLCELWTRAARRVQCAPWVFYALLFGSGWLIAWLTFADVRGFIARQLPSPKAFYWFPLLTMLGGISFCAAVALGTFFNRPDARWFALLGCSAVIVANQAVLIYEYAGPHLFGVVSPAFLLGVAFSGVALSESAALRAHRVLTRSVPVLALLGTVAVVTTPRPAVATRLYRTPGAALAPFLSKLRSDKQHHLSPPVDESYRAWLEPRADRLAVPPGPSLLPPDNLILVLITVDALRADLVGDRRYIERLPGLEAMRQHAVHFTAARSVAPATQQSISSLCTGLYPAQLDTYKKRVGGKDFLSYHDTPYLVVPRPDITSVHIFSYPGVGQAYALGFEKLIKKSANRWKVIRDVLRKHRQGPLLIYSHFTEPHRPYGDGLSNEERTALPLYDQYVHDVASVDRQLQQLREYIHISGLRDRVVLILSADHGEAFGEHGFFHHSKTVYDEMVRVPLLIEVPGVPAREVKTPVSTIDLAPTVLDLFGQPTPGKLMGQSLLGLVRGETPAFQRPIAMQNTHGLYAMVFPDGYKVIYDEERKLGELFNLNADPGENENLLEDPTTSTYLGTLIEFFNIHARPETRK